MPEWFAAFLADLRHPSAFVHTMKAYRQDFDGTATLRRLRGVQHGCTPIGARSALFQEMSMGAISWLFAPHPDHLLKVHVPGVTRAG